MEIKERFGKAVREQRMAKGISQEELAMRIGADQTYVSRIEAGQMNATLETTETIDQALEQRIRDLFGGGDDTGRRSAAYLHHPT